MCILWVYSLFNVYSRTLVCIILEWYENGTHKHKNCIRTSSCTVFGNKRQEFIHAFQVMVCCVDRNSGYENYSAKCVRAMECSGTIQGLVHFSFLSLCFCCFLLKRTLFIHKIERLWPL